MSHPVSDVAKAPDTSGLFSWLHFQQGILPICKKVLHQESLMWQQELISTLAIPLTFFLAFG
ncbi:MAG: hypothetical protein K2X66_14145, partial [Cyanobacteria bacterium]|nr:hypothetical protein [Cyanobacteriota bacterium]